MKIRIRMTDLWRDNFGWSENASWVREEVIEMSDNAKDGSIRRKIKEVIGAKGMRPDNWAGTEWCWRNGAVGVYAEVYYF
jgi:hypothetical protein